MFAIVGALKVFIFSAEDHLDEAMEINVFGLTLIADLLTN